MSTSPPPQPDPGTLTSLDDLIRQQQSASSLVPPKTKRGRQGRLSSGDIAQHGDLDGDGDDSGEYAVSTPRNRSVDGSHGGDSSMTIRAVSVRTPPSSPPPRDESRWNGFHLWRAESYQRRVSQQERQRQSEEQHERAHAHHHRQTWARARRRLAAWLAPLTTRDGEFGRARMILLTVIMAGLQTAWCLIFAYGTPYLLSLGISKSVTSLVWISAPLSGLIVQPLVGVISDLDMSAYRRRRYIAAAAIALSGCTFIFAFSDPLASILADVLHAGLADWDPDRIRARDDINYFLAISAFVGLNISSNALQAAARALILDVTPACMHTKTNAWSARMVHIGSIVGYGAGWYDLSTVAGLAWLGGAQMRKYAMVSMISVLSCSAITCVSIDETAAMTVPLEQRVGSTSATVAVEAESTTGQQTPDHLGLYAVPAPSPSSSLYDSAGAALQHIWQTIRRLPRPIRRICLVQMLAFVGWFPFLIYATEWVIEVRQAEQKSVTGDDDEATEMGSFALLMFAVVGFAAGVLLPYLALANWTGKKRGGVRLEGDDGDIDGAQQPSNSAPPRWRLSLRTLWTASLVLFSVQTSILTFFVHTTTMATALVASIGVPWAVAVWVPFALVMESVREAEDGMSPHEFEADWFAPARVRDRRESRSHPADANTSTTAREQAVRALRDCEPLNGGAAAPRSRIVSRGGEVVADEDDDTSPAAANKFDGLAVVPGGQSLGATILGIHNIALVLPQLFVALIASALFRDRNGASIAAFAATGEGKVFGVVWMLRFGGLAALGGAVLTRFVPLSRTERLLRGDGARPSNEDDDDDDDDGSMIGGAATPTRMA